MSDLLFRKEIKRDPAGVLVSDFDGTITRLDFYDLVCQAYPQIAASYWQDYESGKITHFEALKNIFAGIRAPESRMLEIIGKMDIDPAMAQAVRMLEHNDWSVVVASAGCAWYINRLLQTNGVNIAVHANPGTFLSDGGLQMQLPPESPLFSRELGVNKVAVVREALRRCANVAFAGDGRPDLAPALLVPPRRRFAKSWLAKKLHEIGEEFRPFERWSEVAGMLGADEGWSV